MCKRNCILLFCFLVCSVISYAQPLSPNKIPIDTSRWYQMNYTSGSLGPLFDGDKNSKAFTGWSKILSNYDAYYPLLAGETMRIDSIRFYDKEGVFTSTPMKLYVITDTWQRKLIATFTGEAYNAWVGPYPSRPSTIKLDTSITNVRYLLLNIYNNDFPGEIEMYGGYTAPTNASTAYQKHPVSLNNMTGINGFEWDMLDAVTPKKVNPKKMEAMKSFGGFRHYMDWEKIEEVEGRYKFNPTARGGWHYDSVYKYCKEAGIDVLACFKTLPPWMIATYPSSEQAWDNNPVRYGSDLNNPQSYIETGRIVFQYAARYGSNTQIDSSLVSVWSVPNYYMEPVNDLRIGMNLVKYFEYNNEEDKWWKGRKAYMTGREYAVNLSVIYDGHKNTMGPGIGIKNADSTMIVVMGGTAATSTDYLRGMIDWCKEFRGYKPDGSVNLCWDVINYHLYANDAANSQSGSSTRGAAPEKSNCAAVARKFLQVSHDYAYDMPVWITEQGYDINQGSPLKAIAIGNKSVLETQADWILRSALLYSREGLQKSFFYQVYDANVSAGYKFSSMGLINKPDTLRKPAADYLYQLNKLFGNYVYQQTLNADPIVDKYQYGSQDMYMLVVPDEVGRTVSYQLSFDSTVASVTIYRPQAGSSDMQSESFNVIDGSVTLTATETPMFVVPSTQMLFSRR